MVGSIEVSCWINGNLKKEEEENDGRFVFLCFVSQVACCFRDGEQQKIILCKDGLAVDLLG